MTYYAAFLRPGALWNPDRPVREQVFWDDHARYMDALFDSGTIVLGGPFADRTGARHRRGGRRRREFTRCMKATPGRNTTCWS